jgi:hypothetical protein
MSELPTPYTIGHRAYSATGDDGFGNPVESWAAAVSRAVYAVAPGTPGEDYEVGRVSSRIPLIVLGPKTSLGTVHARDRMVWAALEFEVDGEPGNFDFGPFGWAPGMRVRMIRVEG